MHCCHNYQGNIINHFIVTIRRLSRREVVGNALPSSDEVDIDNKINKGNDKSSGDEMLNIELWPECQCTSYNGRGGRGQRPVSGRVGGLGSTSGGRGGGGQATAPVHPDPCAPTNNITPSNDNHNGINGDGANVNLTSIYYWVPGYHFFALLLLGLLQSR